MRIFSCKSRTPKASSPHQYDNGIATHAPFQFRYLLHLHVVNFAPSYNRLLTHLSGWYFTFSCSILLLKGYSSFWELFYFPVFKWLSPQLHILSTFHVVSPPFSHLLNLFIFVIQKKKKKDTALSFCNLLF